MKTKTTTTDIEALRTMRKWTRIAMANEASFIERFAPSWVETEGAEVLTIGFSGGWVNVTYVQPWGAHTIGDIPIKSFLTWVGKQSSS